MVSQHPPEAFMDDLDLPATEVELPVLRNDTLVAAGLAVVLGLLGVGTSLALVVPVGWDVLNAVVGLSGEPFAELVLRVRGSLVGLVGAAQLVSGLVLSVGAIVAAIFAVVRRDTKPLARVAAASLVHLLVFGLLWAPAQFVLDVIWEIAFMNALGGSPGAVLDLLPHVLVWSGVPLVATMVLSMLGMVMWAGITVTQDVSPSAG